MKLENIESNNNSINYASFGIRLTSSIIDNIILNASSYILAYMAGQSMRSTSFSWLAIEFIFFMCTLKKQASPAKLLLGIKLANESDFQKPSNSSIIRRYILSSGVFVLYYLLSLIFILPDFIWYILTAYLIYAGVYALFNNKVQSWYDKQTKIVVIYE